MSAALRKPSRSSRAEGRQPLCFQQLTHPRQDRLARAPRLSHSLEADDGQLRRGLSYGSFLKRCSFADWEEGDERAASEGEVHDLPSRRSASSGEWISRPRWGPGLRRWCLSPR